MTFTEHAEAVSAAAATGTNITTLSELLRAPVAELITIPQSAEEEILRFPLLAESVTLGRSKGDLVFPQDLFMSRLHARVYHRGENFFIEDAGSRNGTFISIRSGVPIESGETILVGSQVFRIS